MSLPKVLILNQPFVPNTGGGITMSNLFQNWDKQKLAVACSGYLITNELNLDLCNNYYQLGSKERRWMFPLNIFSRKYFSGRVHLEKSSSESIEVKASKLRVKMILDYVYPVFEYIGFSNFMAKTSLSPTFCKWLDDFAPDVVYAQASSRESVMFCTAVQQYLDKPLVFHMMDDWPATLGNKGFMKKYWRGKVDEEMQVLLDNTELGMSISDYMAQAYKSRYEKEFTTFHNPINLSFWKSHQRDSYDLNLVPTILYAGRIGLGIDKSLISIAKAIEKLNEEQGMTIKFALQTQDIPNWIEKYDCVEHRKFVAYEDLPKVFAEADFLILPYDFSDESLNYIKYSMPTKAPEYMASGTPIIIFAPEDTALVQYARDYKWADVVTENKLEKLISRIKCMILDKTLRTDVATAAKDVSETRHDADVVASDFQQAILSVIKKKDVDK